MSARSRPYLVLLVLWAVYFHPLVLHPGRVLYADYSDFAAEHLPAKLFLNRHWQATGTIPLWNPYHFCGTPFVHDIQVGIFYPPYAVTYLVPESAVGAALSWVIALHVLLAGVFTYVYARWRGLGEVGGLVAAVGFMLSAKWMTNLLLAGHTITVGLAWLPLVLLGLEAGLRSGRVWSLVGAGVAFALLALGTHPQWTLYAALFAALWALGPTLERAGYLGGDGPRSAGRTVRELARWALGGLAVGGIAAPLTAVQLLPTWEAAGQSVRTLATARPSPLIEVQLLAGLVGPAAVNNPPQPWEQRALLGVFWLTGALAAPLVVGRRASWPVGALVGLVAFSVGGGVLAGLLPGFGYFRLPARALVVAAFPVAFLAGTTTDAAVRSGWDEATRRGLRRALLLVLVVAVVPALTCLGFQQRGKVAGGGLWTPFLAYWAAVALAIPAFALVCLAGRTPARVRTGVWLLVLLAELVTPLPPVEVRDQAAIYPGSRTTELLGDRTRPGQARALDWYLPEFDKPVSALGAGAPQALAHGFEVANGYNPLDVRHYREFLGVMLGGDGSPQSLGPVALPILPNFDSRHRGMFDLLGVRTLVAREGDRDPLKAAPWRQVGADPGPPAVPLRVPGVPDRLPPHTVYENPSALPRAWVVPEARAIPADRIPEALRTCDFRQTVLLTTTELPPKAAQPVGRAAVTDYRPDRVAVRLENVTGGFLVLADVWFPGWVCRVDGQEVPVYRANHAFRAVALPAGAREAVFTFEPRSYRTGWWVSAAAAALLLVAGVVRLALALRPGSRSDPHATTPGV